MKTSEMTNVLISEIVQSVQPDHLIQKKVSVSGNRIKIQGTNLEYDLSMFKKVHIIGSGKASAAMAKSIEKIIGEKLAGGVANTRYGYGADCNKVDILEGGHPITDKNSLLSTEVILNYCDSIKKQGSFCK